MAKRNVSAAVISAAAGREEVVLSAEERKFYASTKAQVMGAVQKFAGFREASKAIGERIVGQFNAMVAARPVGTFGLADFARGYDSTVPFHARETTKNPTPGYSVHATYMALDYMKRSMRRTRKPESATGQGVPNPTVWKLERTLATLLSIVKPTDHEIFWTAMAQVFGIKAPQMVTLRRRVAEARAFPILDLHSATKPFGIAGAKVGPVALSDGAPGAGAEAASTVAAGLDRLEQRRKAS